jgi:hypothetical protein
LRATAFSIFFFVKWVSSAAKHKIRLRNLKIWLISDHISTKNQTKTGPKLAILR